MFSSATANFCHETLIAWPA